MGKFGAIQLTIKTITEVLLSYTAFTVAGVAFPRRLCLCPVAFNFLFSVGTWEGTEGVCIYTVFCISIGLWLGYLLRLKHRSSLRAARFTLRAEQR